MVAASHAVIPDAVARLLAELDTFEKLDLILLMGRETDRPWTVRSASSSLRIHVQRLQSALDELCARGIASHTAGEGFRIEGSNELAPVITSLCALYEADPSSVLNRVMAASIARGAARFAAPRRRLRR